jgi:hypothetical protein
MANVVFVVILKAQFLLIMKMLLLELNVFVILTFSGLLKIILMLFQYVLLALLSMLQPMAQNAEQAAV